MVPPVMEILPTDKVPEPTSTVELTAAVGALKVMEPLTASVFGLLMEIPFALAAALIVMEAHCAPTISTVTVTPVFMITASPATGYGLLPHVAVLLQFPLTEAVLAAA